LSYESYDPEAGTLPPPDGPDGTAETPRPRPGLPWERRLELGPGAAVLQTVRQVIFSPAATFRDMRVDGGWAEPLAFAVLIGSIFFWVAQVWEMLLSAMMAGLPGFDAQEVAAANTQQLVFAALAPFMVAVATLIAAAFVHLLLLMFGGAPRPFEATFRVMCYSWAVAAFNVIPICGVVVGAVWRVVVQIIGVREAQGVPAGRAAAAVLIPVLLGCLCLLFALVVSASLATLAP
jgi:hypothetical protein